MLELARTRVVVVGYRVSAFWRGEEVITKIWTENARGSVSAFSVLGTGASSRVFRHHDANLNHRTPALHTAWEVPSGF